MAFPADVANRPVLSKANAVDPPGSDPEILKSATSAILEKIDRARNACILPGLLARQAAGRDAVQALVDASGLPFATMFADKSVLEEQQPAYIGLYDGKLTDEAVREFVESCDAVLMIGALMSDFNTGAFTARLDAEKTIDIRHHRTHVGSKVYPNIEMNDVLSELAQKARKRTAKPPITPMTLGDVQGTGKDPITVEALYPRWANFLRPNDILFTETGTSSMGLAVAPMPTGATFHNQTLWGAIGWATPAAFGASVAAQNRRMVLVTGEGSHQLTAQEICQFGRRGLKPVVFVLNNSGYLIERLLSKHPDYLYNDIAQWNYSELPHALGCEGWVTARVTNCGEFDTALKTAAQGKAGAYIEVVTDKYAASPLSVKLHESVASLYRS